ncbi:MAG: hypothetical protein A2Z47_06650 [Thermodesulfovibrio sp. RBG_19FT_COMBO_42_12]|nr:MAG: hypothetical protein A2Z47_06650 [Thermodesulfovibrio sp. RBG_19FT_COMBO_42_12]
MTLPAGYQIFTVRKRPLTLDMSNIFFYMVFYCHSIKRYIMPTRKSKSFRELISFYRRKTLEDEFFSIQKYGTKKGREMKLTEKDIKRFVFEDR